MWPQVILAASAAAKSQWSTPVVVVPAHYREWGRSPPWATKLPPWASTYIYQRTKKGAPRYSPNYGYEAGVHLQFISEHYDDLPELVVFTQAKPMQHNPLFFDTLKCLNSHTNYTSLNWNYQTRGTTYWRKFALQGVVEQCWRDLLDAFGVRLPSKVEPVASFYCCAQMAASRDMIRRHPRSAYEVRDRCPPRERDAIAATARRLDGARVTPSLSTPSTRHDNFLVRAESLRHAGWGRRLPQRRARLGRALRLRVEPHS